MSLPAETTAALAGKLDRARKARAAVHHFSARHPGMGMGMGIDDGYAVQRAWVAWLANKIAAHGESLRAGDVVLAGSFTRPTAAVAGDNFHIDYAALGAVSLRFI